MLSCLNLVPTRYAIWLVAAVLPLTITHERPAILCSLIPIPTFRSSNNIYFLGVATADTVAVDAGRVKPGVGEGHSGIGAFRAVYGQVVDVERIGASWQKRLGSGTRTVILVPWDYGPDCRPVYWTRSARWLGSGSRSLLRGVLRSPEHWAGRVPTLDVFAPPFYSYDGDASDSSLTPDELLDLVDILPVRESLDVEPDSAIAPLLHWARSHPALARRSPAREIVQFVGSAADDARLRLLISPFAGTYRVTIAFGSGDSTVLYARTELHPMSSIDAARREDVERDSPTIGYYLMTQYAATVRELPQDYRGQHTSYHAASLAPVLVTRDSSVWRGEVDPLAEVASLESRAVLRSEAFRLVGVSRELKDPDSYFMPGYWITYPDGRVRYEWIGRRGQQLLYAVRAERISTETTIGSSH